MIPQPQNQVYHIQKRWDLETIEVISPLQEQEYEFEYDHEKSTDYHQFKPSHPQFLKNLLKFEFSKDQLKVYHNTKDYRSSFYLNQKLDNSKNYLIQLSFDRKKFSDFILGIISEEQIGKNCVEVRYSDFGGGNTKEIKGQIHCSSSGDEVEGKSLELRINISKRYWRIATIPDYSNISELNSSLKMDSSKNYYLAFSLENSVNLLINGIYEVSEFHNHN